MWRLFCASPPWEIHLEEISDFQLHDFLSCMSNHVSYGLGTRFQRLPDCLSSCRWKLRTSETSNLRMRRGTLSKRAIDEELKRTQPIEIAMHHKGMSRWMWAMSEGRILPCNIMSRTDKSGVQEHCKLSFSCPSGQSCVCSVGWSTCNASTSA